jgi:YVTN family beta-propeller protein
MRHARAAVAWIAAGALAAGGGCSPRPVATSSPAGTTVTDVGGFGGRPFAVRVSSHGRVFVTQQDLNSVALFSVGDTAALPARRVRVTNDPGDVIVTADGGEAIASTFYGGMLHFLDGETGRAKGSVRIGGNAYRLALSADDARVYVTTTDGDVHAVDRVKRSVVGRARLGGRLQAIDRRPGASVLAVASTEGRLWLLDERSLEVLLDVRENGNIQDVVHSRDGSDLFIASESPAFVAVLDARTLERETTIHFPASGSFRPFGLALSPDGATLIVTSPFSGEVALIDARARSIREVVEVGGHPRRVTFEPRGRRAFVANEDNRVHIIR